METSQLPASGQDEPTVVMRETAEEAEVASNTFENVNSVPAVDHWDTSGQVVITTTESDMRNILHKHVDAIGTRDSWIPPLTVVVAIGVALIAGIKSNFGRYVLVFGLGMAVLWLAYAAKRAWACRKHAGIDAVLDDLRPQAGASKLRPTGSKK